jgi:hypothetical protein
MGRQEAPLSDRIAEIDVAAVDSLARLFREREVLEGRLQALEERRGKVSPAVHDRVRADYRARLEELESQARPLGEEARRQYAKLAALHEAVEKAEERVRLDREEIELRHELGELEAEELEQRAGECDARLEERRAELAAVEELRRRFLEAVRSEEELLSPPPGAVVAEASEPSVPEAAEEGVSETPLRQPDATILLPSASATEEAGVEAGWQDAPTGEVALSAQAPPVESIPVGAQEEELVGATRILSRPRLVLLDGDQPGESFFLGPQPVTIGRGAGSEIQLLEEAISRRHAEVKPGIDGFVLRDLGSENGTFVNGGRVDEHLLAEGDVVQVGSRRLVFREL